MVSLVVGSYSSASGGGGRFGGRVVLVLVCGLRRSKYMNDDESELACATLPAAPVGNAIAGRETFCDNREMFPQHNNFLILLIKMAFGSWYLW